MLLFSGGGLPSGSVFAVGECQWIKINKYYKLTIVQYVFIIIMPINFTEEDVLANYSRVLIKYFLAEGVACKHALFIASADEDAIDVVSYLSYQIYIYNCQNKLKF